MYPELPASAPARGWLVEQGRLPGKFGAGGTARGGLELVLQGWLPVGWGRAVFIYLFLEEQEREFEPWMFRKS